MKFMQTLDILLFKKSISNVQFWYFLKIFLYKLDIQIKLDSSISRIRRYPTALKYRVSFCLHQIEDY